MEIVHHTTFTKKYKHYSRKTFKNLSEAVDLQINERNLIILCLDSIDLHGTVTTDNHPFMMLCKEQMIFVLRGIYDSTMH